MARVKKGVTARKRHKNFNASLLKYGGDIAVGAMTILSQGL